jgi:acetoin:2,6-dichlorophenolindophenol oxidoreductase subunit beta
MRQITYTQAVNEALDQALEQDESVICYGLGTDDPKGVFGTTLDLHKKYGSKRVFDMPTSENAMTGVAIGASLNGIRPVMCHQRLDFFLLAMDQLVNNAAKWSYMFGDQGGVPITIRLIIGRGWGQGPTHSQNLQSWFAHIPGLKVVIPTNPYDAKGMLLEAIFDDNPVIFLEHRWLHNMQGEVPQDAYRVPLNKAQLLKKGNDVTIVSLSYMTIEALHAAEALEKEGIDCDLIDLRTVNPIDWNCISQSIHKTGRLLVVDTASQTCSVASEIIAHCSIHFFDSLKKAPQRLALPDIPTPTSQALSKEYYFGAQEIVREVLKLMDNESDLTLIKQGAHDTPGDWFKGPF